MEEVELKDIKRKLKQLSKNELANLCLKLSHALEMHMEINQKLKEAINNKMENGNEKVNS